METQECRNEFLNLALECGAILTGKPDGSEAVSVVFTVQAWQAFDRATSSQVDAPTHQTWNDHDQGIVNDLEVMASAPVDKPGWWSKALANSALRIIGNLRRENLELQRRYEEQKRQKERLEIALERAKSEVGTTEPTGTVQIIDPPEFRKYNPNGLEGQSTRAELWEYGQLVGWRTAHFNSQSTAKPFPAPGEWFPVGLLGHPMREFAPGKWENAVWPSEQLTGTMNAENVNLPSDVINELWNIAYNVALQEAGLCIGNADVAYLNQPTVFAKLLRDPSAIAKARASASELAKRNEEGLRKFFEKD